MKGRILRSLKETNVGMTTQELCKKLSLERHTLSKYLEALRAERLVEYKEIGRTKVWSANKAPLFSLLNTNNDVSESFKELLNNLDEKIYLVSKDKSVMWANNKVKGVNGRKCFENFNEISSCEHCPAEKSFVTGQKETYFRDVGEGRIRIATVPIKDINGQTVAFLEMVKEQ